MSSSVVVSIPRDLWLTSNRPVKVHAHRARIVRDLHTLAALAATGQRLVARDRPVHVTWTIRYPKGTGWKHGDPANAHPTTKALLDGLVLKAYLPGDGPLHVRSETFTRGPNLETAGVHVVELALTSAAASHGAEPDRYRAVYAERFGL